MSQICGGRAVLATAISTVYGMVTDQATGLPVVGATVTLNTGAATTTGSTGAYTYGNLPAATYSVTVTQPGYQSPGRSGLVVTATTSAKADILMPTIGVFNITTTSLPWGSSGVSYRSRVMVAGGTAPYDFGDVSGSLPPGLSLDASSGLISGTPSGSGSYTFAIGVADSATGYSEKQYTLDLVSPLLITTATIPTGLQAAAYSATITASGGKLPHSFSISSGILPNGISLDSSGALSGTLREAGSFTITVRVTDATGRTYDKQYALPVTPAPALALDTTALPAGYTGSYYTTTLSVSGGVAPLTFRVEGTLPDGLTLDQSSGKISGSTTSAGQTNLIITVTDNTYPAQQSVSKALSLRIWTSGVCGVGNNGLFTTAPANDLCTAGTASAVTGSGPWKWTCHGGGELYTACSAYLQGTPVIQLPKTGQTGCWDLNGNVIDCVTTGQDGELQAGASWPDPRFSDNGDQTMTDNLTKLVWSKDANPGGNTTWQSSLDYIKGLNSQNWLGHHDWRLPNINELKSLINSQQPNQSVWLASQGFGNIQSSWYWSSTNYANNAWVVTMSEGYVRGDYYKGNGLSVWPVRGGQFGTGIIPRSGQTSCWDYNYWYGYTQIISCAGTGQDGDTQTGAIWPTPRFSNNSAEMVTDNLTGLIWSKDANPAGNKNWQQSLDYVKGLNSQNWLGHNDWRLPNREELSSILNRQETNQTTWLTTQGFGNVQQSRYWSSSNYAGSAWTLYLDDGRNEFISWGNGGYVWPVRGGKVKPSTNTILGVTKTGPGSGTVGSSPGTISWWSDTSGYVIYTDGPSVTLTSYPDNGSSFAGWTGCDSTNGATCTVLMNTAKSVSTKFDFSPVDGRCGGSNGGTFSSAPTTDLCSIGAPSDATHSGNGPWSWTCAATNGGKPATCVATYVRSGPTLTVSTLPDGSITNNATLNITGTVTDEIGIISFTINGVAVTVTHGAFSRAVTLATGTNTITIVAIGTQGNSTTNSRTITLDQTAPTLTITTPADNSITGETPITVTGTVNEAATVKARVGTGAWQTAQVYGASFIIQLTLANGQNTIEVTATDVAGNVVTATAKRTITFDGSAPALAITNPNQDITTALSSITLSGTVSDQSVVTVTITHNGQTYTPAVTSGAFSQQLSFPVAGGFPVIVTASDIYGRSTTVQRNIIYQPPSGATLDLGAISCTKGATATVPLTLANVAGIDIASLGMDIAFDSVNLLNPTATVGAAGTAAGKTVSTSNPATGIYRIGLLGFNTTPIGNGTVATVSFTCSATGPFGAYTLTNTPSASDAAGETIIVTGKNGTITIAAKPGDCNSDGTINIAEVQGAINMYLGLKTIGCGVDTNSSTSVSIAEVQKVINGYLGL